VLRGKDVHELEEMKQMGLSVLAISEVTGYDRKVGRQNGTLARRFQHLGIVADLGRPSPVPYTAWTADRSGWSAGSGRDGV
jgi:hypothetical protein